MKRVLCLHGVGGKDSTLVSWSPDWKKAIAEKYGRPLKFTFLKTDDLFEESRYRMNGIHYLQAIRLYLAGWLSSEWRKSFRDDAFLDAVRLYAGMPAQFITDDVLRGKLRNRMQDTLTQFQPDLIFAHSLGSLIAYDALHNSHPFENTTLVTAGSQLCHPCLHDLYGGPLQPLPIHYWLNLHNKYDKLFASRPLRIRAANFSEEDTPFEYGSLSHDVLHYIRCSKREWKNPERKGFDAMKIPNGYHVQRRASSK